MRRRLAAATTVAGRVLAVVSLALVLALTLTPAPVGPPVAFGHWCIVCGGLGAADVVNNVLLFVPLGVALALAGARARSALGLVAATTIAIELLQLTVIVGRFATLGDVLMNTAGGMLGFAVAARSMTRSASRRSARTMALVSGTAWLAVLAGTGWAMVREPSAGPARPVPVAPPFPEVQWYNGGLTRAVVDGHDATRPDRLPLAATLAVPGDSVRVDAWVTPTNTPRARLEFFVVIYDPRRRSQILLGRDGRDLVFRVRTRSSDARFRQPAIVVRDAFPADEATPPPGTWGVGPATHVAGILRGRSLLAGIDRGRGMEWQEARLSPNTGWALLVPYVRGLDDRSGYLTILWLVSLAIPLGYHTARWTDFLRGTPHLARRAFPTIVGAAWVIAGLLVAPRMLGFGSAPALEWAGAVAGLAIGAAVAKLRALPRPH